MWKPSSQSEQGKNVIWRAAASRRNKNLKLVIYLKGEKDGLVNGQTSVMVSVCTCPRDWRQHGKGGQDGLFGKRVKDRNKGVWWHKLFGLFFFKASFGIFGTTTKFSFQKALDPIALIFWTNLLIWGGTEYLSFFRLSLFTIHYALSICSKLKYRVCSFGPWSMCQLCLSF